jgi:hypothetical protein
MLNKVLDKEIRSWQELHAIQSKGLTLIGGTVKVPP